MQSNYQLRQVRSQDQDHLTAIEQVENAILQVLDGPNAQYSLSHVLLLSNIYDFTAGTVYLLEKSHNVYLLLDLYLQQHSTMQLLKLLRKLGNKHPEVFIKVLTYFVQKSRGPNDSSGNVTSSDGMGQKLSVADWRGNNGGGSNSDDDDDAESQSLRSQSEDDESK